MASSNLCCVSLSIPQRPRAPSRALLIPPCSLQGAEAEPSLLHTTSHILCSANWSELLQAHGRQSYLSKLHIYPLNCFSMAELPELGCGKRTELQEIGGICSLALPGQNGGSKPPLFLPCKWENYAMWLWPKNQYLLLNYRNKWQLWWPITNWWLFLCSVSPSVKPTAKGQENMTDLSAIKNFLVSFVGAHLFMALCQSE